LSVRNGRYWSEILSQHYNFDRDVVEVEVLRGLTKEDVLTFYKTHIADSTTRRKLSCQVISTCEGGAGHPDTKTEPSDLENDQKESNKPRIVTDITAFKSSLPLFPLAQPFVHPEELVRARP